MVFTEFEADIGGSQRKVISAAVTPARLSDGENGIALRKQRTLPFRVTRMWSAPAGHYPEQWYLVDPETKEVIYEGPQHEISIWGLQAPTEENDEISTPLELKPGTYLIVFALGGVKGGELEIAATDHPSA